MNRLTYGRMCRIVDGDTIVVRVNGKENRIRLYGIDAPERGQPYFKEASDYLKSIVDENVRLYKTDRQKTFRRTVAIVYSGSNRDESLNIQMLRSGYAHYDPYSGNLNGAEEAEQEAMRKRRGMWASGYQLQKPWDYRAAVDNEPASQGLERDSAYIEDTQPRQLTFPYRHEPGRGDGKPKPEELTRSETLWCVAIAIVALLICVLLLAVCND